MSKIKHYLPSAALLVCIPLHTAAKEKPDHFATLNSTQKCLINELVASVIQEEKFTDAVFIDGKHVASADPKVLREQFSSDPNFLAKLERKAHQINRSGRRKGFGRLVTCVK